MADSKVDIVNRALGRLGSTKITSFQDGDKQANLADDEYEQIRRQELRRHPWRFAIKRASISASTETDPIGNLTIFNWPADCIRVLPINHQYNINTEWEIEGRKIFISDSGPLEIRYIHNVEDVGLMDDLFKDALAMRLAMEWCETLTNSNPKLDRVTRSYEMALAEAKRVDGIEAPPRRLVEGSWVTIRFTGAGSDTRPYDAPIIPLGDGYRW